MERWTFPFKIDSDFAPAFSMAGHVWISVRLKPRHSATTISFYRVCFTNNQFRLKAFNTWSNLIHIFHYPASAAPATKNGKAYLTGFFPMLLFRGFSLLLYAVVQEHTHTIKWFVFKTIFRWFHESHSSKLHINNLTDQHNTHDTHTHTHIFCYICLADIICIIIDRIQRRDINPPNDTIRAINKWLGAIFGNRLESVCRLLPLFARIQSHFILLNTWPSEVNASLSAGIGASE